MEGGTEKGCVTLWDVAGGKAVSSLDYNSVSALAFSPDGKILARSAYVIKDNRITAIEVCRRDLTRAQDLPPFQNTASNRPLTCLAFSADARTLAGADYEGNIIFWDTATAKVGTTIKQEDRR